MDIEAAKIAMEEDIDILVFNVEGEDAIINALNGTKVGTLIKKEI